MSNDQKENQDKKYADISITFRGQYDAVIYEDILGYQIGGGAVAAMLKDGRTIIYPLDTVQTVVHTIKE